MRPDPRALSEKSKSRHHEIDALRSIALGLLIVYHVFVSYQPFAEKLMFIPFGESFEDFWFIGAFLNVWRIPILFLISGMAIGFLGSEKNIRELVVGRLTRLVPPLFFASFALCPLIAFLFQAYTDNDYSYVPSPFHLWFLPNLVCYLILLLPLLYYFRKHPENVVLRLLRLSMPWGLPVLVSFPLALESAMFPVEYFEFYPYRFFYCFICYAIGFILVSMGSVFWETIRIYSYIALIVGASMYLGRVVFINFEDHRMALLYTGFESGVWILAFLGLASRFLSKPSPFFQYLNKAVFPIYIIHLPIQQSIAFLLFPWEMNRWLTLILHAILTFSVCGIFYECLIKRIQRMHPFFGIPNKYGDLPETVFARFGRRLTLFVLSPITIFVSILIAFPAEEDRLSMESEIQHIEMK